MADLREALIRNYLLAKKQDPSLTKAGYMQRVFPGRYKNDASAYAAYQRVASGQRKGGELVPLIEPRRTFTLRGEQRPRQYMVGMWKTIIHFNYIDSDGNLIEDQEISFNMESSEHVNLLAVPFLEEAVLPIAEQYLIDKTEQSFESAQLTYIEVIPINQRTKSAIDLDTLYLEDVPYGQ